MLTSIQDALVAADDAMFDASKELYMKDAARRKEQHKKKLDGGPLDKDSTAPITDEDEEENRTSPRGSRSTCIGDPHGDDPVAEFYRAQALKAEAENKLPAKDWARNFPSYFAMGQKNAPEKQVETGVDGCERGAQKKQDNGEKVLFQKDSEKEALDVQLKTATMRGMLKERLIGVLHDDFVGGLSDDQSFHHE